MMKKITPGDYLPLSQAAMVLWLLPCEICDGLFLHTQSYRERKHQNWDVFVCLSTFSLETGNLPSLNSSFENADLNVTYDFDL